MSITWLAFGTVGGFSKSQDLTVTATHWRGFVMYYWETSISRDGHAVQTVYRHNDHWVRLQRQLTPTQVKELRRLIVDSRFFDLQESYPASLDGAGDKLTIRLNGRQKTVQVDVRANQTPETLRFTSILSKVSEYVPPPGNAEELSIINGTAPHHQEHP